MGDEGGVAAQELREGSEVNGESSSRAQNTKPGILSSLRLLNVKEIVVSINSHTSCQCEHIGLVGFVEGISQTSVSLHGIQLSGKGRALSFAGLHAARDR